MADGGTTELSGPASDPGALRRLAADFGCEFRTTLAEDTLDPGLIASLPVEWARANRMLPIRDGDRLALLTADPTEISKREDLELLLGEELVPIVAPPDVIAEAIETCYFSRRESAEEFLNDLAAPTEAAADTGGEHTDLLRDAARTPITQLVNLILLEAIKARASDIHIEPLEASLRVRYRIDGCLYGQAAPPKHLQAALISRLKVMAHMDIAEKRLPQDGMARVRVGEREVDVRVSSIPVAEGERIVLRLLNRESTVLSLDQLGMAGDTAAQFAGLLHEPHGVIIVSGPTGSGKTTTLYAALQELDAKSRNILTIEDPIEYQLPQIGQMQVRPKIGLTFAQGLRHMLRQDPDVILVGETRDVETAEIVIQASLTGHLVFTTLHTNDAAGAAVRLADMGVESYLLAGALRGVLAQRLVRRLCPACRSEARMTPEEVDRLGPAGEALSNAPVWEPVGCDSCLAGYRGRLGLYELMSVDEPLADVLRVGQVNVTTLRDLARQRGMRGLLEDGLDKVRAGDTSLAEVLNCVKGP